MMNGSKPTGPLGDNPLPTSMPCRRRTRSFPSPRPSPIGRGRIVCHLLGAQSERFERSQRGEGNWNFAMSESVESASLSLRERVRVRGTRHCSLGGNQPFPQLRHFSSVLAEPEVAPT